MITEEIRERARAEAQAVLDRVMGITPPPQAPKPPKPRKTAPKAPSRRGENLRNRPPKTDRAKVKALHDEGVRVGVIAQQMGVHRGTISKILNDEFGLDPADRKGGPARKKMCGKGLHDMDKHGRPVKTGGGRYCAACKAEREKIRWANREK